MAATEISSTDDLIDIRDVIARIEELREQLPSNASEVMPGTTLEMYELKEELAMLEAFMDECEGNGGDEQWEGSWYPVTAIRDSYFKDYAQEFAEDIGAIKTDVTWPNNCIDWDQAARELQMDYTSVEFDGVTYWVR